ncbi:MAG: ferredoxin oxidoreductase, partial [Candidatus Falkowbacteria bacterium]|nr:ferredoxin oxidoreductase [Candidatus Falkowbacteria bacterium]
IVYSPTGLQELYEYTKKAFHTAWKYRFPTFILTDGYTTKLRGEVEFNSNYTNKIKTTELFGAEDEYINYRNCFEYEEEIYELNKNLAKDFNKAWSSVEEHEVYPAKPKAKLDCLIIAHGIVGLSAKAAIDQITDKKVALFRPITLRPFPEKSLRELAKDAKKILIVESATNQLMRLVKESLYGLTTPIINISKPGLGIYPEEIIKILKK